MLNELLSQLRKFDMVSAGDSVICAVSGGADSMALLWGLYLLREKLDIRLQAAHFNHNLRGEESLRDEGFVREFCQRFDIPLTVGNGTITPGKKGLEAAARTARYAFLQTLPGKIATAHTADDNAETVLMHLVRGTGLKGLGGIAPVNGSLIRPMLTCTRQQVLAFLEEFSIPFVEDSSNDTDAFLRNRIRHHVIPLLKEENPQLPQNLSAMAMSLRQEEAALEQMAQYDTLPDVETLKKLHPAVRSRMLERFLEDSGVKEPERSHIALVQSLVFSENPSASGDFPGGVTVRRVYDRLEAGMESSPLESVILPQDGSVKVGQWTVTCGKAEKIVNTQTVFTVASSGPVVLRCRQSGDTLRLQSGTKSVKKLFIDRKIPASERLCIPVVSDDVGVLGVYGIGVHQDRAAKALPALQIRFEKDT